MHSMTSRIGISAMTRGRCICLCGGFICRRSGRDASNVLHSTQSYRAERLVLDPTTMSYWRKLIIVVLLALSLPVQSFAAISMKCACGHSDGRGGRARHAEVDVSEHHREMHGVVLADDVHRHDHGVNHHAHSGSTCSCCFFGTALPTVPAGAVSSDATCVITRISPSAFAVSFLTGGIERPPRYTRL